MDILKGYVERIIYRNPGNGYTVLSVDRDGTENVAVGTFPDISAGEYIEFTGEYAVHPRFGEQFRAVTAKAVMPEDADSLERYLSSGAIKGIGAVTARRIIEKFGDDTLRILDEEPERLAEIKGISRRKALEIASQQEEKKDLRNVMIFLGDYGISNQLSVKLYGLYGNDIYTIIRENPYRLSDEVGGVGFRKADEIAFRAGVAPGSDYRISACIIYTLQKALEQGHVYLPDRLLKSAVMQTLQPATTDGYCEIEDQDLERCITDLAIDSRIIIKTGNNSGEPERQIYYSANYYTELQIARMMHDLNIHTDHGDEHISRRISAVEKTSGITLDQLQKDAVKAAADSGVVIITGGPGTGKTTTINALIRYFEEDGKEILLAAPTGRAAKRMTEATGCEAKTIHRMLELSDRLEDSSAGARFNRNEDNPVEADVIIVDEMSMVDIFLMNALLRAIVPGTRLILVGDVDQLPSVGPGNILRDLIESHEYNTVRLVKIFRQAEESEIVVNAHKINRGEPIKLRTDSRDFIFLKRETPQAVAGAVLSLMRDKLPAYVNAQIRDVQVLAPMKKGELGILKLNRFLQESLNPPSPDKNELPVRDMLFREGDKVMHIRNNYDIEWEMRTSSGFVYEKGSGVFNGDIGIIRKINEHTQLVEVLFDDGKNVIYQYEQLEELTLAYASTIHKAQGSEYPAVIIPLLSGPPVLMNRNILYTGVTRARKCVVIVGSETVVEQMIANVREHMRYTGLKDRIRELERSRLQGGII
ncbi:MAG: ATP-dependent RecD-like DNA helicase [Parasporobacterium sp.]|nr:ATP-dependent RecD-like DNA helicase [Parasporobacterium sp.]